LAQCALSRIGAGGLLEDALDGAVEDAELDFRVQEGPNVKSMRVSAFLRSGRSPVRAFLWSALPLLLACASENGRGFSAGASSSSGSSSAGSTGSSGSGTSSGGAPGAADAAPDSSYGSFGDDGGVGPGPGDSGGSCNPPDLLIVLDHTDSMSAQPAGKRPPNTMAGHMLTKWYLATQAVKGVVAPPMDQKIAYGLEPFPFDPQVVLDAGGSGTCETLTDLLSGTASTNKSCGPGEVLVRPAIGTGATITGLLDPETMRLCVSTPIALALDTAMTELRAIARSGVGQYVLLVTDGGETCKGDVVGVTQQLASAGIKTFVVGFGSADAGSSGVNKTLLNNASCAGMTAAGFPAPCTKGANGYTATTVSGPPLFFLAEDGASLQGALQSIASSICCGCAQ
jgi:hypothetical protein